MTNFLEIALRNAARGFRVMPIRGKNAFLLNWPALATTNEAQIKEWSEKFPNYNCGVAGGSDITIVDSDGVGRLKELCGENWSEWFSTYSVSSGRPDRAHFYFRTIPEVLEFGNKRHKESGIDGNVYEVKTQGAQVTAEGSTHPDTGSVYMVTQDLPLLTFPVGLPNLFHELYAKANPTGKREWNLPVHDGEGRDDFLTQQAGRLRHVGCSESVILAHLEEINGDTSVMADPKAEDDLKRIARSAARYDVPAPVGEVVIGLPNTNAPTEPVEIAEKSARPIFPDEAWAGTIFGAFADIVCRGNFIRKRLASESFRAITGAIAGDQVTCGIAGVRMREYHAIISHRQSGKSYALDCAVNFYTKQSSSNLFSPMLMLDSSDNGYRLSGVGAQRFLPGSPNSFVDELERENKKQEKHKRGDDVDVIIGPQWKPTARLITIQGEAMALFSRLCNPDWAGQALSAVVTDLYDSLDAEVPITRERGTPKIPVRLQYSMVLCTQPLIWRKYMAAHMMDSGLFGRFYIVGSEFKPRKVLLPDYSDAGIFEDHFGALRRDVFARLDYLRDHPLRMTVAPDARRRLEEWENALPDEEDMDRDLSSRMGLHVWRAAMARAWGAIPQRTEITLEDAEAVIKLGEYQIKMRQRYAPTPGDSPKWKHLNAVKAAIEQAGRITLRDLRMEVRGDRFPEDFDWSLAYLEKRGQIVSQPGKRKNQRVFAWTIEN
jgi:hypothetical protein